MAKTQKKQVKRNYKSRAHPKNKQSKSFLKVYWPYFPMLAIALFGLLIIFAPSTKKIVQHNNVLAYATEISRGALLNEHNRERANHGVGTLTLNSKLNNAAQAKANDMVARNYWSHNTPDGKEPWVFFDSAGYAYLKAGENLAYGYLNSASTVTAWMNSAGHRANILDGNFTEVGFGFANSSDYVSTGEETIVVAMFGKPQVLAAETTTPPPAPAPTPTPATATPKPAPKPTAPSSPAPAETPAPAAEPAAEQPSQQNDNENDKKITLVPHDTPFTSDLPAGTETKQERTTRIQQWTHGAAPWSAAVLTAAAFIAAGLWLGKHARAVRRFMVHGEEFILHHPLIDVSVVMFICLVAYLTATSGFLR